MTITGKQGVIVCVMVIVPHPLGTEETGRLRLRLSLGNVSPPPDGAEDEGVAETTEDGVIDRVEDGVSAAEDGVSVAEDGVSIAEEDGTVAEDRVLSEEIPQLPVPVPNIVELANDDEFQ